MEVLKVKNDENDENFLNLEITEVVLIHCNIVNKNYQKSKSAVFVVSNKSLGQLIDILPKNFTFLETLGSKFLYIEVWFTDKNCSAVEIEDKKTSL